MDWIRSWIVEAGYSAALGVHCDDVTEASVALSLPYADGNSNPGKALHGGCAASLGVIGSWATTGIYQLEPGEAGVVLRLGARSRTSSQRCPGYRRPILLTRSSSAFVEHASTTSKPGCFRDSSNA